MLKAKIFTSTLLALAVSFTPSIVHAMDKELTVTAKMIHGDSEAWYIATGSKALENSTFYAAFFGGVYKTTFNIDALPDAENNTVTVNYQVHYAPWYKVPFGYYAQVANGRIQITASNQGWAIPVNTYGKLVIVATWNHGD